MISRVLLDLDGVLADFSGGVRRLFKLPRAEDPNDFFQGVPEGKVWDAIKKEGAGFWHQLDKTDICDQLIELAKNKVGEEGIHICTSAGTMPDAAKGKMMWIRDNLGAEVVSRTIITRAKYCCANEKNLLIDDLPKNITSFIKHGGIALLFPTAWNQQYQVSMFEDEQADFVNKFCRLFDGGKKTSGRA